MRSQRYFYDTQHKRPIQMAAYVQCSSLLAAVLMILSAVVFGLMASFAAGRRFLEMVLYILIRKNRATKCSNAIIIL